MQPGAFVRVFNTSLRSNQSTDEAVNYVKQTVFGVSNGNPILSDEHFAGGLFHWRKDDSDRSKCSLRPADYTALPLYFYDPNDAALHTALLNVVFWYVFQDVAGWQSMGMMARDNAARIDYMTTTKFPPVPTSLTGPALNKCP